jgi:hypothetical protein
MLKLVALVSLSLLALMHGFLQPLAALHSLALTVQLIQPVWVARGFRAELLQSKKHSLTAWFAVPEKAECLMLLL